MNDKQVISLSVQKQPKLVRNRGGCLSCRKRKVKCDEMKPECKRCSKSNYVCFWPKDGNESLSHKSNFKLVKKSNSEIKFISMNKNTIKKAGVIDEDALIRRYIRENTLSVVPTILNGMNHREMFYYDAFINGFIVSISNQLAHEKLLPGTIIVPRGLQDPMIKKLCISCGESFIFRCQEGNIRNDEIVVKVRNESLNILDELIRRIDNNSIMQCREWMLIYFILWNARQKFLYEGRHAQTINLISGIEAIKLWVETQKVYGNENENVNVNDDHDDSGDLVKFENADIYILGEEKASIEEVKSFMLLDKLVNKRQMIENMKSDKIYKASAFERTLLETFVFNYSCTLLTIDKSLIKCVPSPYEVFKLITPLLETPIFNCPVPWMNNPTMGAALPIIEYQAKIIWLSFQYNDGYDDDVLEEIQRIYTQCENYEIPTIINVDYPDKIIHKLLESCYISKIISIGVYIFATKILQRNKRVEYDEKIRVSIEKMFEILNNISQYSQTGVIAKWAFVVTGCAIIDNEQRRKLRERLLKFIDVLKTGSLRTTVQFLDKVWDDEIGLDALFIEDYLNLLVI